MKILLPEFTAAKHTSAGPAPQGALAAADEHRDCFIGTADIHGSEVDDSRCPPQMQLWKMTLFFLMPGPGAGVLLPECPSGTVPQLPSAPLHAPWVNGHLGCRE